MSTKVQVQQTTWLASGVVQLVLRHIDGAALPAWEPGAHIGLRLPNGLVRQYSLCGDPADEDGWTVAVLHTPDSRGGSEWIHQRLTAGTVLEVDGPRNNFPLVASSRYLFIAGGIGITPLLPMVRALAEDPARRDRWQLLYCGRSRERMAFLSELAGFGDEHVSVHADDEHGGPCDLAARLATVEPGTTVYCCGPEPLISAVEQAIPDGVELHVERFRLATTDNPVEAGAGVGSGLGTEAESGAFDVVCAGSGARVRVEPDVPVLDALQQAGFDMPFSCREGVCGSCETPVVTGEPDHRDAVLSEAERDSNHSMMVCVSRSHSPELVLDLDETAGR
ncbi:PDR/VanB family oxidoreductase [Haloechinothrix sp. LS1_15]|uniref:PDR/VanB family oxidoreductase n=1 Tax=Haloechinothrix sp. LS1_15 TaxID=2652248 RepID=UPI0029447170|nr:PDR/VanB family oxidoreductase [Haloechinothrix sp. LS1_15]MDV6012021.1 oxidoreductase [Haloechinothrix sp. LS1_15]